MVSVCIPIYKPNANYFKELADSLKKQTIKQFEIIISDDSDSKALVDEVFAGLNYTYLKNNSEKGIFFNLNNAIKNAQYEYIQILCHDDFCDENLLASQFSALVAHPNFLIAYTQSNIVNESSKVLNYNAEEGLLGIPKEELIDYLLVYGCLPGNLSAMMITKKLINKIGLFSTKLPYAADFYYCVCAAQETGMLINLQNLINIRNHKLQASFTLKSSIYINDIFLTLRLIYSKTTINKAAAFKYINAFYGVALLRKVMNKQNIPSSLLAWLKIIFKFSPINFFVALPYVLLHSLKIATLSKVKQDFIFSKIPKI